MPYREYAPYGAAGNPPLGHRPVPCERLLNFFACREPLGGRPNASDSDWEDVDDLGPSWYAAPRAPVAGNAHGAPRTAAPLPAAESDFHFGIVPVNAQQRQIAVAKFAEMATALGMNTTEREKVLASFPELFGVHPSTFTWIGIRRGSPWERNAWVEHFERQYTAATAGAAGGAAGNAAVGATAGAAAAS